MTFDEVGTHARLSGGPSPATNIPVVHTLLMAIQSTSDLEPKEPKKRYEKNGRVTAIILVQIGPVVKALEQFSRMQNEREQTLVNLLNILLTHVINTGGGGWGSFL